MYNIPASYGSREENLPVPATILDHLLLQSFGQSPRTLPLAVPGKHLLARQINVKFSCFLLMSPSTLLRSQAYQSADVGLVDVAGRHHCSSAPNSARSFQSDRATSVSRVGHGRERGDISAVVLRSNKTATKGSLSWISTGVAAG
jgi:hypothetical protein